METRRSSAHRVAGGSISTASPESSSQARSVPFFVLPEHVVGVVVQERPDVGFREGLPERARGDLFAEAPEVLRERVEDGRVAGDLLPRAAVHGCDRAKLAFPVETPSPSVFSSKLPQIKRAALAAPMRDSDCEAVSSIRPAFVRLPSGDAVPAGTMLSGIR